MTTLLKIGGMTCQNCARHVREALEKVPGVESAQVNLDAARAQVKALPGKDPTLKALIDAVVRAGYTAEERAG